MAWTKEQERAIYERGQNIIVSAGAGSGKTAVLSERILDYCKKGFDIRNVLVLTFTKAASLEMKERIRNKLLANNLVEQANYIDVAYITTFDAYSLALVKKYYYKLDLSKDISIMDGALISVKTEEIINDYFANLYQKKDSRFFNFLAKYSKQDDKEVVKTVKELINKLGLIIDFDEFVNNYLTDYYSEQKLDQYVTEYGNFAKSKVNTFLAALDELINELGFDPNASKYYDEMVNLATDVKRLTTYEEYYKALSGYTFSRISPKFTPRAKSLKTQAADILGDIQTNVLRYPLVFDMKQELIDIKDDVMFLLNTCKEVMDQLFNYKKQVMLFDYSDIAHLALKLVKENPDVLKELASSYNEILVDEYQDTSDIQEAFIKLISHDNLYMVGDIKQSIYRFRNANPYIFKEKYDQYSKNNGGSKIDLSYNFRSRQEVLNNINTLFSKLMTDSCGDANYLVDHQMNYGLHQYDNCNEENYNIELLEYSKGDKKDLANPYRNFTNEEVEAFIVGKTIKDYLTKKVKVYDKDINRFREVKFADFAILVDKSKSFVTFKKIFEYLKLPLNIEADLDLKASIMPKLFSNILLIIVKLRSKIYDTQYRHALASVARSFLYEYSDEDVYRLIVLNDKKAILNDFYELANLKDISYPDLFFAICDKLNVYDLLTRIKDVENSLVVLEYIHTIFEGLQKTSMTYAEASAYLENIITSDVKLNYKLQANNPNSIRIMTIHKSKGLEFPYCFLPLINSLFNQADVRASIGYHADYGVYIPFAEEGKSNTILKTLIADKVSKADLSEKVRLLYVAMTRAREKLIVVAEEGKEDSEFNQDYRNFLQMFAYANVFSDYTKTIDLANYYLTSDYKNAISSELTLSGKEIIIYEDSIPLKKVEAFRISKEMHELPEPKQQEAIKLGLEFHSALEVLDFKNPDVESLPASLFIKQTLLNLLNNELFHHISKAKTYHEHEFYFQDSDNTYHGIIDLLVVYEDHVDIIDYKLSNLESVEYLRQTAIYKQYVSTKFTKPINVYLLSIINQTIKKLDV